jgi:Rrf2 family transcriptional regulator, nitric oxide-sensitive transcriptional repressor
MKVTYELGKHGYIETIRGRGGGIRLSMDPAEINIGSVVRKTEDDFYLVECFNCATNRCVITPVCKLRSLLRDALEAYFKVLDGYALQDLLVNKDQLGAILFMK